MSHTMKQDVFRCMKQEYAANLAVQWTGDNFSVIEDALCNYALRLEYSHGDKYRRTCRLYVRCTEDNSLDWLLVEVGDYFVALHGQGWKHFSQEDFKKQFVTE